MFDLKEIHTCMPYKQNINNTIENKNKNEEKVVVYCFTFGFSLLFSLKMILVQPYKLAKSVSTTIFTIRVALCFSMYAVAKDLKESIYDITISSLEQLSHQS